MIDDLPTLVVLSRNRCPTSLKLKYIVYVSKQTGHSRPSITADVYAHLLDKRRPHAAAKTDDLLFGKAAVAAD